MGYGTGESGIICRMTREEYFSECDTENTVEFFCQYFGVTQPILKRNPTPSNPRVFRGLYCPRTQVLSYNRDMTGLIIHELAHHIVQMQGKNGSGHHNPQFWEVLQEMHDLW